MSSRRRNGSVSRAAEAASKNRLHMDRNPQHSRITDPSNPAGRRKEIDNVMKRARQGSPGTWDRKLLEVEEKDPNRWRHTGYKQLYLDGSRSPSSRRSRTPALRRSRSPNLRRSRSPLGRRSRTPMANRRSPVNGRRSPLGNRRSPIGGRRSPIGGRRSPVGGRRSPIGGRRSPVGGRRSPIVARKSRSRSPIVRKTTRKSRSRSNRKSPRRTPKKTPPRRVSPVVVRRPRSPPPPRRESPRPRIRAPPIRAGRPPSPPDPRKSSGSGSSVSSCSDESCSVCSAKNKKAAAPPPKPKPSATASPRPKRPANANNAAPSKAVQPTRELLKARESSKRSREEKVLEWQRSQLAVNRPPSGAPIPPGNIKREGERRPPAPAPPPGVNMPPRRREERGVSPAAIQAALADSESDSESDASSEQQPQRLTLSERFGKMAQWSADRSARLENMRITRRETTLHVRIERGERESSPDLVPAVAAEAYPGLDPEPIGSYPEELLAVAPGDMPSWDDVRVRYDYYKKRGYLRGLTLSDYVKWEEWWYKYQEWLKRERAYERWAEGESQPVRRERRRRGGRHRRS